MIDYTPVEKYLIYNDLLIDFKLKKEEIEQIKPYKKIKISGNEYIFYKKKDVQEWVKNNASIEILKDLALKYISKKVHRLHFSGSHLKKIVYNPYKRDNPYDVNYPPIENFTEEIF